MLKFILSATLSFVSIFNSIAQKDSQDSILLETPNAKYAQYKYDSTLKTNILTYQYGNLWDLDNDGTNDSIAFIGNGGAHTYFHLEIKLSSSKTWIKYPTFLIDMPYWVEKNKIEKETQFAIIDSNENGVFEVYLNIDNPLGEIPDNLKKDGITSKQVIIEYVNNALKVRNY